MPHFLEWVSEKSSLVETPCKPSAIRAFYFALPLAHNEDFDFDEEFYLNLDIDLAGVLDDYFNEYLNLEIDLNNPLDIDYILNSTLKSTFFLNEVFSNAFSDEALECTFRLITSLEIEYTSFPNLQRSLQHLKDQLADPSYGNIGKFERWWKANGRAWTRRLKAVMIEHRNIGHDWQFSDAQLQLLHHYYNANKLLVDCLNSDCYVSREVRQGIEDTLLLPMSEIEKRQQGRVG
ncbi:MAG TPA: hypothetical protein V6D11_11170 [Waterburya sp.]